MPFIIGLIIARAATALRKKGLAGTKGAEKLTAINAAIGPDADI
jgi:hypothetical protein